MLTFTGPFIGNHCFDRILDSANDPSHRFALIRLICGSHRRCIETGRWQRPVIQRENRICALCYKLDDEFHFLFECASFTECRKKFMKKYYWQRPSMLKCVQLFKTNNKKDLRNLAKYIWKCFSIRTRPE